MRFRLGTYAIMFVFFVLISCRKENEIPVKPTAVYKSCTAILINGYTEKTSYFPGEKIIAMLNFSTSDAPCNLNINNIDGTLAFTLVSPTLKQTMSSYEPSSEGFGFSPSVEIPIPTNQKSGVY